MQIDNLPETIQLPFVTITFVPKDIAETMTSLDQLESKVIQLVNKTTSEIFSFHLRYSENKIALQNERMQNENAHFQYEHYTTGKLMAEAIVSNVANFLKVDADQIRFHTPRFHQVSTPENEAANMAGLETELANSLRVYDDRAVSSIVVNNSNLERTVRLYLGNNVSLQSSVKGNKSHLMQFPHKSVLHGTVVVFGNQQYFTISRNGPYFDFAPTKHLNKSVVKEAIHSQVKKHFAFLGSDVLPNVLAELQFDE